MPVIFGDDTNGGTIFTPRNTSSYAESEWFLRNQFPYLTLDQLAIINSMYPPVGPLYNKSGPFWRQVSNAYGEMRYLCPGLFCSSAYSDMVSRVGITGITSKTPRKLKKALVCRIPLN